MCMHSGVCGECQIPKAGLKDMRLKTKLQSSAKALTTEPLSSSLPFIDFFSHVYESFACIYVSALT